MATMNISLPDKMREWIEQQVATGRYANSSDYVRDLVRRDGERVNAIAELQREIDIGIASGISDLTLEEVISNARAAALKALEERDGIIPDQSGGQQRLRRAL